ncbi:YciI family protein [Neobacillus sp. 3P2-tot-E-2]|uniref:YciI family protein n=1 Tax=Neobacillus sp. 3P2-tot-E-2 TaxID=3132212 RepID=UPI0039A147A4
MASIINKIFKVYIKNITILAKHYNRGVVQEGKLILAGRTLNMDPSGMGIVILEVDSEEEARELMENDPAVKEGIFHIA